MLNDDGFMVTLPSVSPDGERVAFLSNNNRDFSLTDLYVADADGKNVKRVRGAVTSRGVFSPRRQLIAVRDTSALGQVGGNEE